MAWGTKSFQLKGAPAWLDDRYDTDAKAEGGGAMTPAEFRLPRQALLKDPVIDRIEPPSPN